MQQKVFSDWFLALPLVIDIFAQVQKCETVECTLRQRKIIHARWEIFVFNAVLWDSEQALPFIISMRYHPRRFWNSSKTCLAVSENMSRDTAFPTRLHVRPSKTQISLRESAGWSESSLSAWRHFGALATHRVPYEYSDQTVRMRMLIWAWRTGSLVGNAQWKQSQASLMKRFRGIYGQYPRSLIKAVDVRLQIDWIQCRINVNRTKVLVSLQHSQTDLDFYSLLMAHAHGAEQTDKVKTPIMKLEQSGSPAAETGSSFQVYVSRFLNHYSRHHFLFLSPGSRFLVLSSCSYFLLRAS